MINLTIGRSILKAMLAHLKSVYPSEGCGLLAGKDSHVHKHYPIDNRLQSPTAFEMEPAQLVAAMTSIEAQDLNLLAIYHSHPHTSAYPSPTDIAQANYPNAVQIIVSFKNAEQSQVMGYRIIKGQVSPVILTFV